MDKLWIMLEALYSWLPYPLNVLVLSLFAVSVGMIVVDVVKVCWSFVGRG